jgi:diadenosine tetraphosphatase ApaH/serine/threonine PP2A family protein phosphatase
MRYGIISDVHSNIEALSSVLRKLEPMGIESYVCLGDVVGYGASPNECSDIIRELCDVTLLGNHDAAVAGRMDYSFYYEAARHALDWSATKLSAENMAWLRSLPYTARFGPTGFSHGSPLDAEAYEYIFALEQAEELSPYVEDLPDITFIGHSHLCKAFAIPEMPTKRPQPRPKDDEAEVLDVVAPMFSLRKGYRYVTSVGSVGQPRDYDNRACCVVYDSETRAVEYVRAEYDIETSAQKIFDADLSLNFGRRLFLGV